MWSSDKDACKMSLILELFRAVISKRTFINQRDLQQQK